MPPALVYDISTLTNYLYKRIIREDVYKGQGETGTGVIDTRM